MHFLILYSLSVSITFYLVWLLRPEYVEGFLLNLPIIHWNEIGLILILVNYTILGLGINGAFNKDTRSNKAIITSALIAVSTIGSLISLSFVFNILWSVVTPKYLLFLMIGIYVVILGGPLLVYSIKESENNRPTINYLNAELNSQLKIVLAEIEIFAIKNKLSIASIEKLENIIRQNFDSNINWTGISDLLQNILSSIELPEPLADKVISLQQKIKES